MPAYEVSAHCNVCGHDHPVLLRIYVENGPDRKQSVAELFRGRSLPPQVAAIRGHMAYCYKTGRKFPIEKDEETFLVPPWSVKDESIAR